MTLEEITDILKESRVDPFPIRKTEYYKWVIDTQGLGDVTVTVDPLSYEEYNILHVSFRNSGGYSSDNNMGSSANRVLWSVIHILESIPKPDLFIFYPVDNNEDLLAEKTRIYGKLILLLRRENVVFRSGSKILDNSVKVFWVMPTGSKTSLLDDDPVVSLIEQAAFRKLG